MLHGLEERHVLGNLLICDYADLFTGEEFLKVKRGLWHDSADILCKYCDGFTYEAVLAGKIWQFYLENIKRPLLLHSLFKNKNNKL